MWRRNKIFLNRTPSRGNLFLQSLSWLLTGFFSASMVTVALAGGASDTPALLQLLDDARYWKNRGDLGQASRIWKKILSIRPDDPRALSELGVLEAESGDTAGARHILHQLARTHPGNPGIDRVKSAILLGKLDKKWLLKARRYRSERDFPRSFFAYEKYLKGSPPRGAIALEVLQTEAAVKGRFFQAVRGLRALLARHPQSHRIRLVLARSLINRETTRREGLSLLSVLAKSRLSDISREARSAWRMGLIWLEATPVDRKLYENYLAMFPQDPVVRRLLSRIPKSDARYRGFALLKKNRLTAAGNLFQKALLSDPSDTEAAWGLGLVRMKQGRHGEAADIFRWSLKRDSHHPRREALLAEADYDGRLDAGRTFLTRGQFQKAQGEFSRAIRIFPQRFEAYAMMANLCRREGKQEMAIAWDKKAWRRNPRDLTGALGLLSDLIRSGKMGEADEFLSRAPVFSKLSAVQRNLWRGLVHDSQARALLRERHFRRAEAKLSLAVRERPDDPWIRYRLSALWLSEGKIRHSIDAYRGFVRDHAGDPRADEGLFLLEARAGNREAALEVYPLIPYADRSPGMVHEYVSLVSEELDVRAGEAAREGKGQLASDLETQSMLLRGYRPGRGRGETGFWLGLARIDAKAHAFGKAFPLYRKVLDHRPSDWPLMKEVLGWSLASRSRGWIHYFLDLARQRFPGQPGRLEMEGVADLEEGHSGKAWKDFRKAVGLEERRPVPDRKRLARLRQKIDDLQTNWTLLHQEKPFAEVLGGVSVESTGTFFGMAEAGGLFPVWQSAAQAFESSPVGVWFHLLGEGSFLHYMFAGGSASLNAAGVAAGVRVTYAGGFVDIDLGPQSGVLDQSGLPPSALVNFYAQMEIDQDFDAGNLDFFANYTGILHYLYGQLRFLTPATGFSPWGRPVDLGPEVIFQGNSVYQDGQAGAAIRIPLGSGTMSLLLDGGLLRSNLSAGWGGYESAYFYVRF